MRKCPLTALAAVFSLASGLHAEINPKHFDLSVKPSDDFYQFVNGTWLKNTPIPPEYSEWSLAEAHKAETKKNLRAICERAAAKGAAGSALERPVGDFFASGMDETAINAAGVSALKPELDQIAAAKTSADVLLLLAHLTPFSWGGAGVGFAVFPDVTGGRVYVARLNLGGLGQNLGRDDYLLESEEAVKLLGRYSDHVRKMLLLLGDSADEARAAAAAVMKLETALAKAWPPPGGGQARDPQARRRKMLVTELQALAPEADWPAFFAALGVPRLTELQVMPEFAQSFARLLVQVPVSDWRAYLRWKLADATAPYLGESFVNEDFEFNTKRLTGQEKMKDHWLRVIDAIDDNLGDALGQLYVAEYLPPEARARMTALVENLRAVFRERLQTLEWMDDATRTQALKKLDAMSVTIGYPDNWRDYSSLEIDRASYVRNFLRAQEFAARRRYAKIGQPVDKSEWDETPMTGDARYRPRANSIVFPARFLLGPLFDPKADDAVNYGGIGVIIGHEMTHAFDDRNRRYDRDGNLVDWWTPESAARFKERSEAIVKQFNGYFPFPDLHVNGERTQNENIAELGGVKLAYAALVKALGSRSRQNVDGFTPEQRFFLAYAAVRRRNTRPEELRLQIRRNPHAPMRYRINGPLSNLPEFYAAFEVPEGAPMWRPPGERVTIW